MNFLNNIQSAKTLDTPSLNAFLSEANDEIEKNNMSDKLKLLLETEGINVHCSENILNKEIIMAFIYDEISYQHSHYVREDNLSQMDDYCAKQMLNPKKIRLIVRLLTNVKEILNINRG